MIIFFVTFCLFTIEALLHYNYGYSLYNPAKKFNFPDKETFTKIILTVFIFSLLNSRLIKYIHKYYPLLK
jgi:hypothetical protein